jgi:hypothetical protein
VALEASGALGIVEQVASDVGVPFMAHGEIAIFAERPGRIVRRLRCEGCDVGN